jgi:hypothetical protein
MTLDELHEMWGTDGAIDETKINRECINIPFLHNKYYMKYSQEKLRLLKLEADYKKLVQVKDDYYRGILDPDELKKRGWLPCPLKLRPSEIPKYIETDDDIINLSLKIGYQDTIVDFLKSIVASINYRSNVLKNYIDHKKFEAGGY